MSVPKPQKARGKGFTGKLIPCTPYVLSWPYRTDIFCVKRWQNRPVTDTWAGEVVKWQENKRVRVSEDVTQLLYDIAKMVDDVEDKLCKNERLQKQCGFGKGRAKPINAIDGKHVRVFLPTHFLDILLWSMFLDDDSTTRKLSFFPPHPELDLKPWTPQGVKSVKKYVAFTNNRIEKLVTDFVELTSSKFPRYYPKGRLLTATLSTDLDALPSKEPAEVEHPSTWVDGSFILSHASADVNAVNAQAVGKASLVSSNLWILISSLMYLIKTNDKSYVKRFATAYRFMDVDGRARQTIERYLLDEDDGEGEEANDEEGEVIDGKGSDDNRGRGGKRKPREPNNERMSARLVLAMSALCHSPVFVLDPSVDLVKEPPPYHDLSLKNILLSSFKPQSTTPSAIASEKALWKLIMRTIAESAGSKSLSMTVAEVSEQNSTQLIHAALNKELGEAVQLESVPREVILLEWPWPRDGEAGSTRIPTPEFQVDSPPSKNSNENNLGGKNNVLAPAPLQILEEGEATSGENSTAVENEKGGQERGNKESEGEDDMVLETTNATEEDPFESEEEVEEPAPSLKKKPSTPTNAKFTQKALSTKSNQRVSSRIKGLSHKHQVDAQSEESSFTERRQRKTTGKRKRIHIEGNDDTPELSKIKKPKTEVEDADERSTYKWVTHVDIKLETDSLSPVPPESPKLSAKNLDFAVVYDKEGVVEKQLDDDGSKISVIRHILLKDGIFRRETVTFTVAWPDGCRQKNYFKALLENSQPAELHESCRATEENPNTEVTTSSSKFSQSVVPLRYFDCLNKRRIDQGEFEERERALASSPLLIVPPRSREEREEAYALPILDPTDIMTNLLVDVHVERQVQDSRHHKLGFPMEFLAGSIEKVIKQNRRAMNMLDIPNPTLAPPEFVRKLSLDSLGGPLSEGTGFPLKTMKWNLCATQPALSDMHYDAGKLGTWVRILRGTKIWFVLDGDLPKKGLVDCDPKNLKFVYYVLEEGSMFTMPPGTVHAVLSVTDCIAEGGHMFLRPALHRSLNIGLREHLHGIKDTNTYNTESEVVLHGIWTHFYAAIVNKYPQMKGCLDRPSESESEVVDGGVTYESLRHQGNNFPVPEDMVSLICMCVHALAFEPEASRRYENEFPKSLITQRKTSRIRAEEFVRCMRDLWGLVQACETRISQNLKKSGFNKEKNGIEFIINPLIDPARGRPRVLCK